MQLDQSELKAARDRLARVQGQIGGIIKMIDEGRDCTELLNQLSAASTALSRAGFTIISSGMKACATAEDGDPQRKALEKAFMSLAYETQMKVVIIGGVAGGMSAAARLRRLDENAEITVYEMSEHVSYANCGLPYFVSDVISKRDALLLQTPTALWNRFRIKTKVQSKVVSIDRAAKTVTVQNLVTGETYEDNYDKLVISTGARPRHLAIPGIERAMWLRNVTDADEVKAALASLDENSAASKSVAILCAGFIGIE